jgi:RimJ/RimL family protein N-acetyltransferase
MLVPNEGTFNVIIKPEIFDDVTLRTITETDCDNLRQWKNDNRRAFFSQDIISPQMQMKWFQSYLERENDFMFMVMFNSEPIGCMGFHMLEGQADIYNVILGRLDMAGKGIMSKGLLIMCSYIYSDFTHDIGLKVLRSNLAVGWYEKNGFYKADTYDTYFQMKLDIYVFEPCRYEKLELHLDLGLGAKVI